MGMQTWDFVPASSLWLVPSKLSSSLPAFIPGFKGSHLSDGQKKGPSV